MAAGYTVALDLGNAQTKVMTQFNKYIFPTSLLPREEVAGDGNLTSEMVKPGTDVHTYQLVNNDDVYVWGDDVLQFKKPTALKSSKQMDNRYTNPIFKAQVEFALARAVMDMPKAKEYHINVVTGIPTNDHLRMRNSGFDEFNSLFIGRPHAVIVDGISYNFVVDDVKTMAQPVGSVFNLAIDDDGNVDPDITRSLISIIDLGGRTALFDQINGMEYIASASVPTEFGSAWLLSSLRSKIIADLGKRVDQSVIEQALRNRDDDGAVIIRQNARSTFEITDIANKAIESYTAQILNTFETEVDGASEADTILITGGGANLVDKDMILARIPDAVFQQDSEWANVQGYYKAGLQIFQNAHNAE